MVRQSWCGGVMRAGLLRLAVAVGAAGLLASCSFAPQQETATKEYFSPAIFGPASPKVVSAFAPVPKGGGRRMVGKPYEVAGKTYVPRDNDEYSAQGTASWYGRAFHGRQTANGEVYDVAGLTAAHKTLPLPSYARVTNLENGRSVVVRVNDRGPFAENRLIDVSRAAADMLGFRQKGTAHVQVDYVGPARMDGLDQRMLAASYREDALPPRGADRMFAANAQPRTVQVAAATVPQPRTSPATDGLGALILRAGLVQSYAEPVHKTPAQSAAAALASHDLTTALTAAAERKARSLAAEQTPHTVIQLGTFGSADSAERLAADFSRFGRTETRTSASPNGLPLQTVLVSLDASQSPVMVLAAAQAAGLNGAFVLSR
jgi:rare lipoprotein A